MIANLNNIILGDAYKLIKEIPDKSIDLIITDPPYEFVSGGNGRSEIAKRKYAQKEEIYSLDTDMTKQNIVSGAGCFGPKKRKYHSEFNNTNENKEINRFVSKGISDEILKECVRVLKKINIYIWCNKAQLRQILNYFGDLGCNLDVLTWHKSNPIPTCNNTYLSDTEYCVFAREKGVELYGTYETKSKFYITQTNKEDKEDYLHPTIKPLNIIKNLVINSSREGG